MRGLALVPAFLFAALAAGLFFTLRSGDPHTLPSALIGKEVPEFALPPLSGRPEGSGLSAADLKKGGVSLVNVWASWCAPCRLEHPLLMELGREEGIAVHGINYKDRPESALAFLKSLGDPYVRVGADVAGRAAIDWGVYGVPETFVVDGTGRIVAKHVGELTPEVIREKIRPAIAAASQVP